MGGLFDQTGNNSSISQIDFRPDDPNRIFNAQQALSGQEMLARGAAN